MLNFIKRERIYILIVFFILAVNIMNISRVEKVSTEKEAKSISQMSLEEMDIDEDSVKTFFESEKPSAKFFKYAVTLGGLIFIIALILNLFVIFRRPKINFKPQSDNQDVPWNTSDIVRVSIIIVFMAYVISFIRIDMAQNLHMMLSTFLIDVVVGLIIFYFVIVKYKETKESLGLRSSHFLKDVGSGITAYIFILPLLLVILSLSIIIINKIGYSPPVQPVFEVFMEEKRSRILILFTIFVSVFGPLVEELFFRGFMYSAIKKHLGVLGAAILSASIFSLLHANIVGFLPILTLGILLAYLYEKTGSLVASMTVHVIHNSIILGFVFFIKELTG